jgi:hypothetical protein
MQNINLPIELVNQILGYLGSRPYQESYQLINLIQDVATKQVKAEADAEQKTDSSAS